MGSLPIEHLPNTHKAEFSPQFKKYKGGGNVNDIQSKIV